MYLESKGHAGFYQQAEWLRVLQAGLRHETVCLQARQGSALTGVLPLAFVRSKLFGRFLVSLPYLNSSGIVADSPEVARALVDRAVEFADELDVRYLELRHEAPVEHDKLELAVTDKVHMRLQLPETSDELWDGLKSKLRSQIRKPLNNESLTVHWGGHELLDEFYAIFCRNMRDLGTPPFSRKLFAAILDEFPSDAELCCVRLDGKAIASGLLVHGPGVTEVPSASSLRKFNSTSANMLLYWSLLSRAIERGQGVFDFGRSSKGGTFRFKAQWGATESAAVWQHYVREGSATDMRPNSGKFDLMIRTWQKLPVWMTQVIGPSIVRGIP
ncbi:MAG: FemAB family PEP-CTERM system-associated protein [Planctomycetaceae bacterium]|nr:FemAB family PEP-CTERM system-associated protein [Planctomycetaceae bacterium]